MKEVRYCHIRCVHILILKSVPSTMHQDMVFQFSHVSAIPDLPYHYQHCQHCQHCHLWRFFKSYFSKVHVFALCVVSEFYMSQCESVDIFEVGVPRLEMLVLSVFLSYYSFCNFCFSFLCCFAFILSMCS